MQVTTTTSNTPAIPQRNGPDGRKIAKLISRTSSGRDEQKARQRQYPRGNLVSGLIWR